MRTSRSVSLLALLLLVTILATTTGCFNRTSVDGSWVGVVTWSAGDAYAGQVTTLTLELLQEGSDIGGAVGLDASFMTIEMAIVEGSSSGGTITITTAGTVDGSTTTHAVFLTVRGEFSNSEASGSGRFTVDGVAHDFTWHGQRSS